MNKTKITLISLLTMLLPLAACEKKESSIPNSGTVAPSTSTDKVSESDKSSEEDKLHVDDRLEVHMFGSLYKDAVRSIYVNQIGVTGDIEWTSSDESIVAIGTSPLNGVMPEVNLLANNYGRAVITAALKDDPSIYSEYEVIVSDNFLEMTDDLFSSVSSSLKMESVETYYTYDELYNRTESGKSTSTTIFEENDDQSNGGMNDNLTDAYQFSGKESNGKTFERKYVRDGRYLASEYLDFQNNVRKQRLSNTDGETMLWQAAPYFNYLGSASYVKNSDFVSFDDGKTYHFIGGYETAEQICLNFYQTDISPDDMYFTVEDDAITSFHVVVDPYKGDSNTEDGIYEKYGMEITSTLSQLNTATIEHLEKYKHESYQDPISGAIKAMASSKNYKASVTRKTFGSASENVTYTYTEDTIDIVSSVGNEILTHSGIHKVDDNNYYEYEHNDKTGVTTITKKHAAIFDGVDSSGKKVNRYPTFDFAAEIFDKTADASIFISRGDNAQFISYCSYLPQTWTLLHAYLGEGTIKLDGSGHLSQASATMSDGEKEYALTIDYSSFATAKVAIDFAKATEPAHPTTFEEAYPNLAKEMKAWNIYDAVPFLYYEPGYSDSVGMERDSDGNPNCAYLRTLMVDDDKADVATKFIADYKQLLLDNGYTLTSEKDQKGYDLYQKGDYKISVGNELNWQIQPRPAAVIRVYSSKLNPQF
ncbi:MAG: hypothetical protein SOR23_05730 [Candidatus Enterosoma sp.]|nr:hypothetical protein [Candidatus Enterosoma sp.]